MNFSSGLKNLFVENNVPMKFWVRPCSIKRTLRVMIENGGGELASKQANDVIRLAEPFSKVLTEGAISTRYIFDSVKSNMLLDMSLYSVKPYSAEVVSDFSDIENPPIYVTKTVRRSVQPYTRKEEEQLLRWICDNNRYSEIRGRRTWEVMQELEVLKNRSWQSMKEHFIKKVLPNLKYFTNVATGQEINNFYLGIESSSKCSTIENTSVMSCITKASSMIDSVKNYNYMDDNLIIQYILQHDSTVKVRGNMIWKKMEFKKVTNHSWQSMKERFLKRIIRDIHQYPLATKERNKLLNLVGCNVEATSRPEIPKLTKPVLSSKEKVEQYLKRNDEVDTENNDQISQEYLPDPEIFPIDEETSTNERIPTIQPPNEIQNTCESSDEIKKIELFIKTFDSQENDSENIPQKKFIKRKKRPDNQPIDEDLSSDLDKEDVRRNKRRKKFKKQKIRRDSQPRDPDKVSNVNREDFRVRLESALIEEANANMEYLSSVRNVLSDSSEIAEEKLITVPAKRNGRFNVESSSSDSFFSGHTGSDRNILEYETSFGAMSFLQPSTEDQSILTTDSYISD